MSISPGRAANGVGHPLNPQFWNYYSYWAYFESGNVNKVGMIPFIDQALESLGLTDRRERPTAHIFSVKEFYSTPNLVDQSGYPTKPGLAYQMDLNSRYQSKLEEFEFKLWVLNLLGFEFDVIRDSKYLRWLFLHGMT